MNWKRKKRGELTNVMKYDENKFSKDGMSKTKLMLPKIEKIRIFIGDRYRFLRKI